MKRIAGLLWIVPVLALSSGAPAGAVGDDGLWALSVPKAQKEARETGKPLLVDVWAIWCAPCRTMDEKTWADPGVRDRFDRFVTLKVDADANEVFTARYDAEVLPATLFLDGDGRLITRLTGFVVPDHLNRIMDAVSSGYGEYLGLAGNRNDPGGMARLAGYYRRCDNPQEAIVLLRKAIRKARKEAPAQVDRLELELAETQLLTERPELGAKNLERLVTGGSDPDISSRAQSALDRYRAGLE